MNCKKLVANFRERENKASRQSLRPNFCIYSLNFILFHVFFRYGLLNFPSYLLISYLWTFFSPFLSVYFILILSFYLSPRGISSFLTSQLPFHREPASCYNAIDFCRKLRSAVSTLYMLHNHLKVSATIQCQFALTYRQSCFSNWGK
jgi:hypothetical protein